MVPLFTRGCKCLGVVEPEFFSIHSNEDGLCCRGGDIAAAHGCRHLCASFVELCCLRADLDQLIQGCGFQIPYRETPGHAGITCVDMGHAHEVVEDARYPAAVRVPGRALKGFTKLDGTCDAVGLFLPNQFRLAVVASTCHSD